MKISRTFGLALTAGATAIAACSPGDVLSAPDSGARFDAGDASMVGDATGGPESAPACSALDAGGARIATQNMGTLVVDDTSYSGGAGTFQASFFAAGTEVTPSGCVSATVGPCQVNIGCTLPLDVACNSPNAGVIAMTVVGDAGPSPLSPVNLNPNPPDLGSGSGGGWYTMMYFGGESPFADGDTLTVSANGGEVPVFEQNIVGPGCVPLVTPSPPEGGLDGKYAIPTSEDLAVSWTGGEANALVHVLLTAGPSDQATTRVDCSFEGASGQGTIPHTALAPLQGGTDGLLTVYQQRSTTFQAGSYQIELIARATTIGDRGGPAPGCLYNILPAIFQ